MLNESDEDVMYGSEREDDYKPLSNNFMARFGQDSDWIRQEWVNLMILYLNISHLILYLGITLKIGWLGNEIH